MKLPVTVLVTKYNTYTVVAQRTFLWIRHNTNTSDWMMCWWSLQHDHKLPATAASYIHK